MYLVVYFVLALITFESSVVSGDKSTLCSTWNEIEKSLKNDENLISCTTDSDCYGLNCTGTSRGYDVGIRMHLYACDSTPSIEFVINVPKLHVNNLKRRIYHNDSVSLTENLNIESELQTTKKELILSLFVHFRSNGSVPLLPLSMRIPVINNIRFPIDCPTLVISTNAPIDVSRGASKSPLHISQSFSGVTKTFDQGYSNCTITNSSCGENEICHQLDKLKPDGVCLCISGYSRDASGRCFYDPAAHTSTESPTDSPEPHKKDASNVSLLLTAILVPISVILILVGLVYASIRFRVFQHLRRRLRVQVYEHVLLGDEDEDDMTNPVA